MIPNRVFDAAEILVDCYRNVQEFTLKIHPGTQNGYALFINANNTTVHYDWTINGFKLVTTEKK